MALQDLVFSEVDRQLVEQRAHADALATRAGLLIAAAAVAASLLAGRLQDATFEVSDMVLWTLGAAAGGGVAVFLLARLVAGPSPSQLGGWGSGTGTSNALLTAKILAVEGNSKALVRAELVLFLQAVSTIATLVFLLSAAKTGT